MYVYSEDVKQTCAINGTYAEELFVKTYLQKFGNEPKKTTVDEDRYNHQDYRFILGSNTVTCDVKYPKKISRHDQTFSSEYLWVEYQTKGYTGWLFGKQDYLAFLMPDLKTFKLVKREELVAVCNQLVQKLSPVFYPDEALYKMYHRHNRFDYGDDLLSLIKYEDLDKCPSNITF